ncbi:MAG: hypothetical protein ACUVWX_05820 [Kiritimatiellia bacterium]
MRTVLHVCILSLGIVAVGAAPVQFARKPLVSRLEGMLRVEFELSQPSDVEVAVVDPGGNVIRHLAAGLIGLTNSPSAPLIPGLRQILEWDVKDDGASRSIPRDCRCELEPAWV